MSDKPFPLLNFPPDVLQKVLPYFRIPDIVDLSLCSPEAKEAVKSAEFPVKELNIGSNYLAVMGIYDDCVPVCNWRLYHEDVSKLWHWRTVNGVKFRSIEHPRKKTFIRTECRSYEKALTALFTHFNEIFRCPTESICFTEEIQNDDDFCDLISVIRKCNSFVLQGHPVSKRVAQYVMDNLEVSRSFQIGGVPGDFRTDKVFNLSWIGIRNSAWVTLPILLNIKCQNIDIYDSPLTAEDLKAYIKNWQEGSDKKLEKLQVVLDGSSDRKPIMEEAYANAEEGTEFHEGTKRLTIKRQDGWKGWWALDGDYFQFNVIPN